MACCQGSLYSELYAFALQAPRMNTLIVNAVARVLDTMATVGLLVDE